MHEADSEFARLFSRYGNPISSDDLESPWAEKLDHQVAYYRSLDPTIHVGVLDDLSFNAVASRGNRCDFVAIFLGAIHRLTLYSYQLFADPTFLPGVGDSSGEQSSEAVIECLRRGEVYELGSLQFMPNDPVRRDAAERVAECACLILLHHEVAHLLGCHLDLLADELGISEYQEYSATPLSEQGSLLRRTLELEADSVAIVNSLTAWRALAERTSNHGVDGVDATTVWLMAAELLFWVMSLAHDRWRVNQLASHPSLATRFVNLLMFRGHNGREDPDLARAREEQEGGVAGWIVSNHLCSALHSYLMDENDSAQVEIFEELFLLHDEVARLWDRMKELSLARTARPQAFVPARGSHSSEGAV